MYKHILVPLENAPADQAILDHVKELARLMKAKLLLLHVADGWAARNFNQLKLAESDEMKADRAYLERVVSQLQEHGLQATCLLALGDPPAQIIKAAEAAGCDLIAMASHGHRFLGDIIHGSTIHSVRHKTSIPILLVRAEKK